MGADRDAVDDKENTPLDYALLLQDGADMVTLLQTSPTGTNSKPRSQALSSFRGKMYRLVHQKVSFIQRCMCPLFSQRFPL